jgi:hypothetical protein
MVSISTIISDILITFSLSLSSSPLIMFKTPFYNLTCLLYAASSNSLEIIGSGYGRTGTDTLREALSELGYKTYHMRGASTVDMYCSIYIISKSSIVKCQTYHTDLLEIFDNSLSQDITDWNTLAENNCSDVELLKSIFERGEWEAAVDFPACMCWEQLAEIYPNAKVIHTERESPEKWWESASESILVVHSSFPMNVMNRVLPFFIAHHKMCEAMWSAVMKKSVSDTEPGWPTIYKTEILASYSGNSERVREIVPSERLLVQDHRQGWKLLAEFLGKDEPNKPYPHSNTRAEFKAFMRNLHFGLGAAVILLLGIVAFVLKKVAGMFSTGNKRKAE